MALDEMWGSGPEDGAELDVSTRPTQQRGSAPAKSPTCPGSTSSTSTISQSVVDGDEQELFSPAFHALPEDHSHLDVHDAPAALTRRRGAHEADENTEPPCVSTSSTCTSLGGPVHAHAAAGEEGVVQAAELRHDDLDAGDLDEEDEDGVFDPFAFIKNLPPLPECVSKHRRVLLPRYGGVMWGLLCGGQVVKRTGLFIRT